MTTHADLAGGRVAVVHGGRLAVLDPGGTATDVDLPFTGWGPCLAADGDVVVGTAWTPTTLPVVAAVDTATGRWTTVDSPEQPDPAWAAHPELVEVPSVGGRTTHAAVYPPTSPQARLPDGQGAPYVVFVHGGPTSSSPKRYSGQIAFFTSRGIGVVDVDHGGSTGYGRAYRELLRGQWGVVEVEDCEAVARWLLDAGRATSVAIRGGSAGGWTVLSALTRGGSVFAAGTSYYGVADLVAMAEDTHDFESRYLDGLVGPLPEARAVYDERLAAVHVDRLDRPVLLLQGSTTRSCRRRRPSCSSPRSRAPASRTPTCPSRARRTGSGRPRRSSRAAGRAVVLRSGARLRPAGRAGARARALSSRLARHLEPHPLAAGEGVRAPARRQLPTSSSPGPTRPPRRVARHRGQVLGAVVELDAQHPPVAVTRSTTSSSSSPAPLWRTALPTSSDASSSATLPSTPCAAATSRTPSARQPRRRTGARAGAPRACRRRSGGRRARRCRRRCRRRARARAGPARRPRPPTGPGVERADEPVEALGQGRVALLHQPVGVEHEHRAGGQLQRLVDVRPPPTPSGRPGSTSSSARRPAHRSRPAAGGRRSTRAGARSPARAGRRGRS
jgi:hypothetical protein